MEEKQMKKLLFIGLILLTLSSISGVTYAQDTKCKLNVLYFHATSRCPTCLAIEEQTNIVLQENFKDQTVNGIIKFESINIDEEKNQEIVSKYKIYGSALLLISIEGKGVIVDFTNIAFSYARNNPKQFRQELLDKINKLLK